MVFIINIKEETYKNINFLRKKQSFERSKPTFEFKVHVTRSCVETLLIVFKYPEKSFFIALSNTFLQCHLPCSNGMKVTSSSSCEILMSINMNKLNGIFSNLELNKNCVFLTKESLSFKKSIPCHSKFA